jgi:hypothetical protein
MPTTMQLIAKQTVGSAGAASVTFSSIPQTYTDLQIVATVRTNRSGQTDDDVIIKPNNSTSSATSRLLLGDGSSAASYTGTQIYMAAKGATATANTFSNCEVYVPNYAGSTFKSFSADLTAENNTTGTNMQLSAQLWSDTSAITSLVFVPAYGTAFSEFTEFTLYGISNSTTTQNPTTPSAIGGDVITTDGTYWYHQFLYSGTFTPIKNLTCDYLVVAGGGGTFTGSGAGVGGGGAGGLRSTVTATGGGGTLETPLSLLASTAYTATIGAGGGVNSNGANSVFSSITSTGGGRGEPTTGGGGGNGGSGGAGSDPNAGASGTAGTRTASPVQGNNGGAGNGNGGGGGGGAGSAGTAAGVNDNAGAGLQVAITGSSVFYAAGGGGGGGNTGAAKNGIGGKSEYPLGSGNNTNGVVNTGSGAGGGWNSGSITGKSGGSGIIVVRYAV